MVTCCIFVCIEQSCYMKINIYGKFLIRRYTVIKTEYEKPIVTTVTMMGNIGSTRSTDVAEQM